MAGDPSFPLYASDWLGSNRRAMMSLDQQGGYMNLLCRQWSDPTCSLPDDDDALAKLSEMGEAWMKGSSYLVRACFPKHPELEGRIAHPKLLKIKAEREVWKAKCRRGGKKSGTVRRAKSKAATTSDETKNVKGSSTTLGSKQGSKREVNGNTPSPSPSPFPSPSSAPSPSSDASVSAAQKPCRPTADRSAEIRAVFAHYKLYHPKAAKDPKSISKEWRQIRARLVEGYSLDDLKQAIDGIHKSPYHVGGNDSGTDYLTLNLIMRDSSHVTKYAEMDENPPVPKNQAEQKAMAIVAQFVERKCSQ